MARRDGSELGIADVGHLGLAASFGRDGDTLDAGGVDFTWLSARASVCWSPRRFGAYEPDACGHFEAGGLRASGRDVVNASDVNRPWLAVGGHAALRRYAASGVFGELSLGASVPLIRDRFYFQPNVLIHDGSPVTPWLSAGVGYRFPVISPPDHGHPTGEPCSPEWKQPPYPWQPTRSH